GHGELVDRVGETRHARQQLERRERGRDQVLAPVHGAVLPREACPDDERERMAKHALPAQVLGHLGEALALLERDGHGGGPRRPARRRRARAPPRRPPCRACRAAVPPPGGWGRTGRAAWPGPRDRAGRPRGGPPPAPAP